MSFLLHDWIYFHSNDILRVGQMENEQISRIKNARNQQAAIISVIQLKNLAKPVFTLKIERSSQWKNAHQDLILSILPTVKYQPFQIREKKFWLTLMPVKNATISM